ncbi:MAG: hypothetical protein AAFY39_04945 [Pseudomonadota bacterium]
MEYGRREPMKSESGREPTAFTMKSIKELLAEETHDISQAPTMRTPLPKSHVQQPPHMRGAVPVLDARAPQTQAQAPVNKNTLRTTSAPKVDAEMTARPMPLPEGLHEMVQPKEAKAEPAPKRKSLLGRLIGG